jgi:hypothetical protein
MIMKKLVATSCSNNFLKRLPTHRTVLVLGFGMLGIGGVLMSAVPSFSQSKTAQSGMITIDSPASAAFVIEGTDVYKYDRDCAKARMVCTKKVKTWLGTEASPNTTCTGPSTSSVDSAVDVNSMVSANKCPFFNGGPLLDTLSSIGSCSDISLVSPPSTKESSKRTDIECTIDSSGLVGYSAGPPATTPTCWTLESTTGDLPTITPSGRVAGESALCQSGNKLKYSFTIQDLAAPNGTRVSGLTGTLTNLDAPTVPVQTWSENEANLTVSIATVGADFTYEGKNGANYGQGNPANLGLLTSKSTTYNTACSSEPASALNIQKGLVAACAPPSGCGTYDNFAGNNTASGLELVGYTALSASPGLPASTAGYRLTLTGVIKSSVSGQADLPISVSSIITVDAQGCQP